MKPVHKSNVPTSGAQTDKELPKGKHDIQLYGLATPSKYIRIIHHVWVDAEESMLELRERPLRTGVACRVMSCHLALSHRMLLPHLLHAQK